MPTRHRQHFPRRFACAGLLAVLAACTSPGQQFRSDAQARGFSQREVPINNDTLVVFEKPAAAPTAALHVYLDGDGSPWLADGQPARDPSSRERLVLDLMQRDPEHALLIGRPCYYQLEQTCDSMRWTARRYDATLVAALATLINQEIERFPQATVRVIGYSGGGALAMLLAPRLSRLDHVITVAANLDLAAWARHHRREPPASSLDPASAAPLPPAIRQTHYFGAADTNVPAALMRHVGERQPGSRVRVIDGYDHRCCWAEGWPTLLRRALAGGS